MLVRAPGAAGISMRSRLSGSAAASAGQPPFLVAPARHGRVLVDATSRYNGGHSLWRLTKRVCCNTVMAAHTLVNGDRPVGWLADGTPYYAPLGELVRDGDERVRCH